MQPGGLLTALAASLVAGASLAGDAAPSRPLFADQRALELRLEAPLRRLRRDARAAVARGAVRRREYTALVTYQEDGREVSLGVDVRIRGRSRLGVCDFPPLRLDFKRRQLEGTAFAGQQHLKLVTLCKRDEDHRDYLAQEFQIYRLLNSLTDHSFRVRWARIEYVSTDERGAVPFTEPAFLIEEDRELADRLSLEVIEKPRLGVADLNPDHTALLALFQYVIGNADWAGTEGPPGENCCHNGKVVGSAAEGAFVIPYDFDSAGLINAAYAAPNPALGIRKVTQRLYRGYCATNPALGPAIERLNQQSHTFETILRSGPASDGAQQRALRFLGTSLAIINDPLRLEDEIITKCRRSRRR